MPKRDLLVGTELGLTSYWSSFGNVDKFDETSSTANDDLKWSMRLVHDDLQ